ncbi:MAG: GNAT family N-acetyltransferase [Candidatus Hodarchaeota archaeon]
MNKILNDIDKETLIKAIEDNLDNFYIQSAIYPNFYSKISDKINWVYAKYSDWPSCIFKANFKINSIENEIEEIKSLIIRDEAPNGWTVGPLSQPRDLGQYLEKSGFLNVYHQSGMAIKLNNIVNIPIISNELKVNVINNIEGLKLWVNVVSSSFNIKIDLNFLRLLLDDENTRFYLGFCNRNSVSALILYLSAGVAGLHAVSTLKEYRGKGYGYNISRTALIDAYKSGYKIGVLQASNLGEIIYRKLGFKKYCDIYSYELKDE